MVSVVVSRRHILLVKMPKHSTVKSEDHFYDDEDQHKVKAVKFQPISTKYKKFEAKLEAKRAKEEEEKLKKIKAKLKIKTGGKSASGETEEETN